MANDNNLKDGWIKLFRSLLRWRGWPKRRAYTEVEAFIYLLLSANHEKGEFEDIKIERGQLVTSIVGLAEKWRWSRGKVKLFLVKCHYDYASQSTRRGSNPATPIVNQYS